ncbi:MAG: hypothetical protein CMA29_02530 [Euryarchaeota archaeon]|nr:hypothetical protein [Euryarchaeota archaeon]
MDSFCKLLLYVLLFFFLYNLLTSNTIEKFTDQKNSAKETEFSGYKGKGKAWWNLEKGQKARSDMCEHTAEAMDAWGDSWSKDGQWDSGEIKRHCCSAAKEKPSSVNRDELCKIESPPCSGNKCTQKEVRGRREACNNTFVSAKKDYGNGAISKGDVIRCLWNPERNSCDFWRNDGKDNDSSKMINCTKDGSISSIEDQADVTGKEIRIKDIPEGRGALRKAMTIGGGPTYYYRYDSKGRDGRGGGGALYSNLYYKGKGPGTCPNNRVCCEKEYKLAVSGDPQGDDCDFRKGKSWAFGQLKRSPEFKRIRRKYWRAKPSERPDIIATIIPQFLERVAGEKNIDVKNV